ncbi:TraU family protein [Methylomonas koyamae]|uniref:TraU family protein n=1 Tax=Methylomonas koyamae TaxID=702114 RepID=UPI000AB15879|nr:TraU family protein [Methylomonas koyamae]
MKRLQRTAITALGYLWLLFSGVTAADTTTNSVDPLCSDAELWSGKLITDICWSCLFPIRAAGASLGGGTVPSIATDEKFCFCTDSMNIPELGMTMGLWNPARLIEIVRNPWCSPALGGHKFSASNVRLIATTGKADFDASEMSFFNYHYFAFPLTILLDLFWDGRCNSDGYRDFDLLYVSELDPTWNSDLLAFFTSPETALFANPVAISACVADAVAAATGNPLDALFWCAGAWGHMYPLSGISPTSYGTDPRITSLLATRATASLHRRGLAWKTSGNDALCGGYIYPFIPKSQYRLSMFYPVAETDSNHAIGETTFKWGAGRTYPGPGEDHLYLLWRWQDCCSGF